MREMRRKDREVTDEARIDEIISRCTCCRIGFNDSGEVYIVPLNFGYVKRTADVPFLLPQRERRAGR